MRKSTKEKSSKKGIWRIKLSQRNGRSKKVKKSAIDELHTVSGFSCAATFVPTNSLPKMHWQGKRILWNQVVPKNFFLAAPWIKVTSLHYFKFWRLAESPWEWIFQLLWSGGSVGWFKIHINDNLRQLTYIYSGYNANFSSGFLVCKRIISIFQSFSRRKRYVC